MSGLFINDGLTFKHTVEARGPIPELTVWYRPALAAEVYQWREEREAVKAAKRVSIDAAFLATHLVKWSVTESLTSAMLLKIHPRVLSDLIDAVTGYSMQGQEQETEGN